MTKHKHETDAHKHEAKKPKFREHDLAALLLASVEERTTEKMTATAEANPAASLFKNNPKAISATTPDAPKDEDWRGANMEARDKIEAAAAALQESLKPKETVPQETSIKETAPYAPNTSKVKYRF